jgi:ATP/maltotriose-dependent transcriptional regulator MalT
LTLAQVSLLLGEIDKAKQQTTQAMEESRRYDQSWLLACTQRLMGDILSEQGQLEQAEQQYEQAIQEFRARGMRLDYARTLQKYGIALLRRSTLEGTNYQEGLSYLHEARQHFIECQAVLDLQVADHKLVSYDEKQPAKKIPT